MKKPHDEDPIWLSPCESGYRVKRGDRLLGHLLLRIWGPAGLVEDGVLAVPASIYEPSRRYDTVGQAFDYLYALEARQQQTTERQIEMATEELKTHER